jgi:hypothetical protein
MAQNKLANGFGTNLKSIFNVPGGELNLNYNHLSNFSYSQDSMLLTNAMSIALIS